MSDFHSQSVGCLDHVYYSTLVSVKTLALAFIGSEFGEGSLEPLSAHGEAFKPSNLQTVRLSAHVEALAPSPTRRRGTTAGSEVPLP